MGKKIKTSQEGFKEIKKILGHKSKNVFTTV
jgi:hypothetical protein